MHPPYFLRFSLIKMDILQLKLFQLCFSVRSLYLGFQVINGITLTQLPIDWSIKVAKEGRRMSEGTGVFSEKICSQ